MNDIQYFAKIKDSLGPAKPIASEPICLFTYYDKGMLQYRDNRYIELELYYRKNPKALKDARALLFGRARPSTIKRTRKRGIEKAKFMDHTSYEWSQWWKKNE